MLKTLVIHPKDKSTDMLEHIYLNHPEYTVCRDEGIAKNELRELIEKHERIIMLGHGTPSGLINSKWNGYLVDDSFAEILKRKDTISAWCYSCEYFKRHNIPGLHTGMIISEVYEEVMQLGYAPLTADKLLENMTMFSKYLGQCIEASPCDIRSYMLTHYNFQDPVTEFNRHNLIVL